MSGRFYFDTPDGIAYRDARASLPDGQTKRLPLGYPSADYRVRLAENGVQRLHQSNATVMRDGLGYQLIPREWTPAVPGLLFHATVSPY